MLFWNNFGDIVDNLRLSCSGNIGCKTQSLKSSKKL